MVSFVKIAEVDTVMMFANHVFGQVYKIMYEFEGRKKELIAT